MAGVAPRVAQAAMRHGNISLTMNTYTYARLLDIAAAVESLPNLPLSRTVAPDSDHLGQNQSVPDHSDKNSKPTEKRKTLQFHWKLQGLLESGQQDTVRTFPGWRPGLGSRVEAASRRRKARP